LGTLLKKVEAKNVSVFISSASQPVKESLLSIPVFQELENKKMFFANTTEALS
jgi:hypothetical protein